MVNWYDTNKTSDELLKDLKTFIESSRKNTGLSILPRCYSKTKKHEPIIPQCNFFCYMADDCINENYKNN